jgi:hypothetical protein
MVRAGDGARADGGLDGVVGRPRPAPAAPPQPQPPPPSGAIPRPPPFVWWRVRTLLTPLQPAHRIHGQLILGWRGGGGGGAAECGGAFGAGRVCAVRSIRV